MKHYDMALSGLKHDSIRRRVESTQTIQWKTAVSPMFLTFLKNEYRLREGR